MERRLWKDIRVCLLICRLTEKEIEFQDISKHHASECTKENPIRYCEAHGTTARTCFIRDYRNVLTGVGSYPIKLTNQQTDGAKHRQWRKRSGA